VGQVLTPAQVATLTYDPTGTSNGTDTFTFTAIDNNGAEDATDATITIPIMAIPPVALDDADLYNAFGTNGVVNILQNDTLSTGSAATTLNASVDINPSTPSLDNTLTVSGEGTYTYNLSNGQVTFVPEPGLTGNPAPINYILIDNNTGQRDTASIVITYAGFPNALNDEDLNNLPGVVGVVNALSNDTLSTGAIANTSNASIDLNPLTPTVDHIFTVTGEGTYQYNLSTGIVTFIPDNGLVGNPTPINYNLIELTSGFTDMATITMTYLLPVIAVNDTSVISPIGANVTLNIVSNDTLSNGAAATPSEVFVDINLSTPGDQNSLVVSGEGIWSYNSTTGEITFDPEPGFVNNPTPIRYILTEALTGLLDTARINIRYGVPPIANRDADLINQPQTSTVINLLVNDLLSNLSAATPSLVEVDLEPTAAGIQTSVLVPGEGNYVYNTSNGNLTFTPAIGYYSNPTPLIYRLVEKSNGLSDTSIVTIQYQFNPSLELIKTNTLMGSGVVGDSVQYDFTVINTGNVPVSGITITDTKISPSPIPVIPSALAPGGTAVASRMYYLTPADIIAGEVINSAIVNGTSSNAVAVKDTSDNGDPGMPGGSNPTRLRLPLSSNVDVKLTGTIIGNCERAVGDIVTYQVKVFREDSNAGLANVVVKDSLGTNFELVSQIASEGSFNISTSRWSNISLAAGDTATLTFQLRILTNIGGLTCVESWVDSLSRTDSDSNPGNRITTEDDIARACISVPISICPSKAETAELSTSLGYTSYQWYRNAVLISGATSPTYTATAGGSYTVIVNGSLCPNGSCCPIVVQETCPCPVEICLPISIRKTR
jgi:CshA-type fibril repeat protein